MSKKRISRVKKGETVVVPVIAERLQELYDRLDEKTIEYKYLAEEISENGGSAKSPIETLKKLELLDYQTSMLRALFWHKVHDTYKIYGVNLGLRDGYCLVSSPEGTGMPEEIAKILRKLKGEIDGMTEGAE